jgi:hypothetical protein
MRHHPNRLLQRLLAAALITLAAMHPGAVTTIARLAAGLILATVNGITHAATEQPAAALLTAGALYIAHQARTTRRPARTRH